MLASPSRPHPFYARLFKQILRNQVKADTTEERAAALDGNDLCDGKSSAHGAACLPRPRMHPRRLEPGLGNIALAQAPKQTMSGHTLANSVWPHPRKQCWRPRPKKTKEAGDPSWIWTERRRFKLGFSMEASWCAVLCVCLALLASSSAQGMLSKHGSTCLC